MADRLNDTDPQSPRALTRTDPGLGGPPMTDGGVPRSGRMPQTAHGAASIDELVHGITGPRPPSSHPLRPRVGNGARTGISVPPPSQARTRTPEEAAAQPEPPLTPAPPLFSGVGQTAPLAFDPPGKAVPESAPPVVAALQERVRIDERTVHTKRRALYRNLAVVGASTLAVALMMVTIMRVKEARRGPHGVEVVVLPPAATQTTPVSAAAAPAPADLPPAAAEVQEARGAAAAAPTAAPDVAAVAAPAVPRAQARTKGHAAEKAKSSSKSGLDDLNRQISH